MQCSTPIPDDSRFCLSCGADVSDPTGATTASLTDDGVSNMEHMLRVDTAGEFEVGREIGRGGMAVVYQAIELRLKRKVAIKVLPPEMTFGKGTIDRFEREAQTAARLDHPNIIPIYRISSGEKLFWYAMKLVEGRGLDDVLKQKGRLELREALEYLEQIGEALAWAHRRDVVHRDIKPANILIDETGRVIVADFGIAKALTAGTLTASGSAIGTPYYMSPEQCRGGEITGAVDQYSLGVMAYQMLSGQLPFDADSAVELIQKHCFVPPPPLEPLCPGLPKGVYSAIERALAKKAGERFRTVGEFVAGLQCKEDAERTTLAPSQTRGWESATTQILPKALRKHRLGIVLATVVAVVSVTIGLLWWRTLTVSETGSPVQQQPVTGPDARSTSGGDDLMEQPDSAAEVLAEDSEATAEETLQQQLLVAAVTVQPDSRRLIVGESAQLTATASAGDGNVLSDRTFAWVSSDNGVATVNGSGTVTAVAPGATTIRATAEGVRGTARITVVALQPGRLIISVETPAWAYFTIDGGETLETPWEGSLPSGQYVIRVMRPGFQDVVDTVSVPSGGSLTRRYELHTRGGC